jgi:hypothetical protein
MYELKINYIKSGALAGLFGAWAIFGLLLLVDSTLGFEPGTLYKVIALAFNFELANAVYIGFLMHMITGVVIGALFGLATSMIKPTALRIIPLGIITGAVAWLALFMPVTMFIVTPSLANIANMLNEPMLVKIAEEPLFIAGALSMHLVYGIVLGLTHYLGIAEVPRISIKA